MPWGLERDALKTGSATPQVGSTRSFKLYAQTVNDSVGNSVDSAAKPYGHWPPTRCIKIKHSQKIAFEVIKRDENMGFIHEKKKVKHVLTG